MLSINTNLSSMIVQNSMGQATSKLNQAIERMSTGFKINHASDNAANYSISTNMTTKMSAYMVAEDNTAMGLDLVTTASEIISQMENKAERLRALSIQAGNGTYGAQSMGAIQSEANALMQEITRLYLSSEYNGISLFSRQDIALPFGSSGFIDESNVDIKPEYGGFIANPKTYTDEEVENMKSIQSFDGSSANGYLFKIETAEDLVKLNIATMNNNGLSSEYIFILANDIDLKQWHEEHGSWVSIGDFQTGFKGTLDGNGHVIKNLKTDLQDGSQGLFLNLEGKIQNLAVENGSISIINSDSSYVGLLVSSCSTGAYINNCYTTGNIINTTTISSYYVGGLTGRLGSQCTIENSYSSVNIDVNGSYVGGLVGGTNEYSNINNCYATGNVSGTGNYVGGLVGYSSYSISNSYATGDVSGNEWVGGLVGQVYKTSGTYTISSSYSLGDVTGTSKTGSFIGGVVNTYSGTSFGTVNISDCYAVDNGMDLISGCYHSNGTSNTNGYDAMIAGITAIKKQDTSTNLQIGINGNDNSRLNFNTNFQYDLSALEADIGSDSALNTIDEFINLLSAKQTELGAVQNRLESALDEIAIQYDNLASSRSTLRDADMAELSSEYIKMQILQQASATLLATANQSPSIALQLI